jgi:DNA-binding MarR family transcriptional regulator
MNSKEALERQVLMAAADYGINTMFLRNAMGRRLGLNITDSECLSLLGIKGISTPTELARYTGLTTGATSTMLDRLEKAGLITRRQNPHDRRGVLIEIRGDAAESTTPLVDGVQRAHRALIAEYSAEELEVIAGFLARLTQNVIEHTRLLEQNAGHRPTEKD